MKNSVTNPSFYKQIEISDMRCLEPNMFYVNDSV